MRVLFKQAASILVLFPSFVCASHLRHTQQQQYTLISKIQYQNTVKRSQNDTLKLLHQLPNPRSPHYLRNLIYTAQRFFLNTPYVTTGADGEGDWCSGNMSHHNCPHIQQDPVYRTDQLVCTTYVSQVLALIQAKNLSEYNKNILSIKYGAANKPPSTITYYNRNNFVSSDFNRVNNNNGLLSNAMGETQLKPYIKHVSTTIDTQAWFQHMQMQPERHQIIRVFNRKIAHQMSKRFSAHYPLPFHQFKKQIQPIAYIPKNTLLIRYLNSTGIEYKKNAQLFKAIPTPSVIEIIRNDRHWKINGIRIASIIHSGILVSHMGLLYRHHYPFHTLIYPRINCSVKGKNTACVVTNVYCQQKNGCNELMFSQASNAYPNHFYFLNTEKNDLNCQRHLPAKFKGKITTCNRVLSIPLVDYFKRRSHGKYLYMSNPSILGIHIEKINNVPLWKRFS